MKTYLRVDKMFDINSLTNVSVISTELRVGQISGHLILFITHLFCHFIFINLITKTDCIKSVTRQQLGLIILLLEEPDVTVSSIQIASFCRISSLSKSLPVSCHQTKYNLQKLKHKSPSSLFLHSVLLLFFLHIKRLLVHFHSQ